MPRGGFRENAGRPPSNAEDLSRSRWFARVAHVRDYLLGLDQLDIIKHAIEQYVHKMVGLTASRVVRDAMESEESAKRMLERIEGPELRPITKDEALTALLHLKISKNQYSELRKMLNSATDFRFMPHYDTVSNHKKTCRPENPLTVNEVYAEVPLQALLEHTVRRIVQAQKAQVDTNCSDSGLEHCTLIATWGMDSATGQKTYKQAFADPANANRSDSSLFAATLNPVILSTRGKKNLWVNKYPQSALFCRPIILEYEKETADYVRRIHEHIQNQIDNLRPIEIVTESNRRLLVKCRFYESQIDGKVFNILTSTTPQSCPVCRTARNQLNVLENLGTHEFAPKGRGLQHGLQGMHALIKFFRLLVNVSYRLHEHRDWPGEEDETRETRIQKIKEACKRELKLSIDQPAPDGKGSSMDGNTSRRAFKDPEKLARVLEVDPDLVHRFRNILLAINQTEYKLHPEIFEHYGHETYRLFVSLYPWMKISPSVHKVLTHGGEIQASMDISIGASNESGAELCHKIRKDVRRNFTRKTSRLDQHTDLFGRCMDLSDPVISEASIKFCDKYRTRDELPPEVLALLDTSSTAGGPREDVQPRGRRDDGHNLPPPARLLEENVNQDQEDAEDLGYNVFDTGNDTDYDEED